MPGHLPFLGWKSTGVACGWLASQRAPRPLPMIGPSGYRLEVRTPLGAVCVAPVPDGVDLYGVLVLVDAVDDAVGPASCGVVAIEGLLQRLAGPVRVGGKRPVDRLHCGRSDIERQVLLQGAPGLAGADARLWGPSLPAR